MHYSSKRGEQRFKNKNLKRLNNHPLIAWSIFAAKKCKKISEIVVSTDSLKNFKNIKKYGVSVPFIDQKNLQQIKQALLAFLKHAIDYFKKKKIKFEYLLLLEPTSPLRDYRDIEFCINKIINNDIETIVSVSKVKAQHPNFLFKINKKNILRPYLNNNFKSTMRRQDIQPLYFLEGSLYISKISTLLRKKTFYHNKTQAFEVKIGDL